MKLVNTTNSSVHWSHILEDTAHGFEGKGSGGMYTNSGNFQLLDFDPLPRPNSLSFLHTIKKVLNLCEGRRRESVIFIL